MKQAVFLILFFITTGAFATPIHTTSDSLLDTLYLRQQAEKKFLRHERNQKIYRFRTDTTIPANEIVNGHVVVVDGNLDILGQINGDVLVIAGDVHVRNNARVNGTITCIGGKVFVDESAHVSGDMLETTPENVLAWTDHFAHHNISYRWRSWEWESKWQSHNSPVIRYNRVEGLFLGWKVEIPFSEMNHFRFNGFVGYGLKSRAWRFQLKLGRWLISPDQYRLAIEAEIHDLTDTKDLWRIPYLENSLAAFFLHEDFHDYFRRRGYSISARQNLTSNFSFGLEYRNDTFESMPLLTNWALFGGKKQFRPNPSLGEYEGNYRTLYGDVQWKRLLFRHYPRKGWIIHFAAEIAPEEWNNQTTFQRYWGETRFYISLSSYETLNIRLAAGASTGELPWQKNFELGGISTLRGYRYKAFQGNNMALANVEYTLHSGWLEFPPFDDLDIILFYDAGSTWQGNKNDSPWSNLQLFSTNTLKSDVGIALASSDGDFRLNIARPISEENRYVVTFRINWPF